MKNRKGFTLIELLVVIAIIALLLSIVIPSLKRAREFAYRAICLSNQKQLGISWISYASDWRGGIVNGCTDYYGNSVGSEGYNFHKASIPWVYGNDLDKTRPIEDRLGDIRKGALYEYVGDEKAYTCPHSAQDVLRSYATLDGMNSIWWMAGTEKILIKRIENISQPALRGVFIDEGSAGSISTHGFCVNYIIPSWWDRPPLRHLNGTTLSFADGHAEYRLWKDDDTIKLAKGLITEKAQPNNSDLEYMIRTTWGKLGYDPELYR